MPGPFSTQVAKSTPFDNSTNNYQSTDVQAAIEETLDLIGDEILVTGVTYLVVNGISYPDVVDPLVDQDYNILTNGVLISPC